MFYLFSLTHPTNIYWALCVRRYARRGTERLIRPDLAINKFTPPKKPVPGRHGVAQHGTCTGMWASGALRKCHGLAAGHFLCAANVSWGRYYCKSKGHDPELWVTSWLCTEGLLPLEAKTSYWTKIHQWNWKLSGLARDWGEDSFLQISEWGRHVWSTWQISVHIPYRPSSLPFSAFPPSFPLFLPSIPSL